MKTTKETMMEYFRLLSRSNFKENVPLAITEDFTFVSPLGEFVGVEKMVRFMVDMHPKGVKAIMRPVNMLTDGDRAAVEIVEEWSATEDVPDSVAGPIKKGDTAYLKIAAFYKVRDGKVASARVYESPSRDDAFSFD